MRKHGFESKSLFFFLDDAVVNANFESFVRMSMKLDLNLNLDDSQIDIHILAVIDMAMVAYYNEESEMKHCHKLHIDDEVSFLRSMYCVNFCKDDHGLDRNVLACVLHALNVFIEGNLFCYIQMTKGEQNTGQIIEFPGVTVL
jgi:hypothetical protein